MGVPMTGSSGGTVSLRPTRSERSRTSRQLIICVNLPHMTPNISTRHHQIHSSAPAWCNTAKGDLLPSELIEEFDAARRCKAAEAGIDGEQLLACVVAFACGNEEFGFFKLHIHFLVDFNPAIGKLLPIHL